MCGITGFIDGNAGRRGDPSAIVDRMTDALAHRGPDGRGIWTDAEAGVALGHRRLAIVDLSDAGRQPMVSACGRFVITYNGEIYNAPALGRELADRGRRFRGHSDTEILLEACAEWGVEEAVGRCVGMFAFALWDRSERRLVLVRDRLGIKPLYWGRFGELFVFGSELKALTAHPGWTPAIAPPAVAAFLRHGFVPGPASIYSDVHKLLPGHMLILPWRGGPAISCYWNVADVAAAGLGQMRHGSDPELTDALQEQLREAVSGRLMADVPVGALLSGGIDSSLVAAVMQEQSHRPVTTFSIGFADRAFDEAPAARAVAAHLGTDHHELYVGPQDAENIIPELATWYDEPFADSSQIPTGLVARLASGHLKVALSGDGGDEGFAGYNRYTWAIRAWKAGRNLPPALRRLVAGSLTSVPPGAWDATARIATPRRRLPQLGKKVAKAAALMTAEDAGCAYQSIIAYWDDPASATSGVSADAGSATDKATWQDLEKRFPDLVSRFQVRDMTLGLPDDMLTKVDRASMATGLEVRVPLLDHRLVAFAWTLPPAAKIRDGVGKWALRQVLERYVPANLFERPKAGFSVPIAQWLRGPLRDWAGELLDEKRLRSEGLLNADIVRRRWEEHLSGRRNHDAALWAVVTLQAWRARWRM